MAAPRGTLFAPPARNPWNLAHHPAGSSSGSAAAVAAGFAPATVGSDTGGSIRGPAAACGIAGLKPTYGRVSRRGVLPNCYSQDHVGPLAWTSEECALMLSAIAGHDPEDPGSSPAPTQDYPATLDGTCLGLTIGTPWAWVDEAGTSEPTRRAFEAALDVLRGLGATIVPVTLPSLEAYSDVKKTIAMSELFAIHGRDLRERPELFGASLRYRVQCGALIRAEDYLQATRMRAELTAAMQPRVDGRCHRGAERRAGRQARADAAFVAVHASLAHRAVQCQRPSGARNLHGLCRKRPAVLAADRGATI